MERKSKGLSLVTKFFLRSGSTRDDTDWEDVAVVVDVGGAAVAAAAAGDG